jgi:hypothetical protein
MQYDRREKHSLNPSSWRKPLSDSHIFVAIVAFINALNSFFFPSSRRTPGPRLATSERAESLGPDFRRDDGLLFWIMSLQ